MTDAAEKPPRPPRRVRLGRVDSLRGIRRALARITNAALGGDLEPRVANTAIYGLQTITRVLEVELLETRLTALEERAGVNDRKPARSHGLVGHA